MSKRYSFWDVVEAGRRDGEELRRILMDMTEQELVAFDRAHAEAEAELHGAGLGDHMEPPVTDDAVSLMAEWIVDQRVDFYDDVLRDMSRAPRRVPTSRASTSEGKPARSTGDSSARS